MADQPEATATHAPPSVDAAGAELTDEASHEPERAVDPLIATCPYLLAADGHWRATTPSGEHRCTAVAPAAPLAAEKQRRLCLVEAHTGCATYLAAVAARRERGVPTDADSPLRRELARTTPVVEIGVGFGSTVSSILGERRTLQAIPAIVLVVALIAVAASSLGRDSGGASAIPTPTPSPASTSSPAAVASASPMATATLPSTGSPSPIASAALTPSAVPTPAATPAPSTAPAATRSYTVRTGDTLYGIASTFGVSVAAIKELNNLTSNTIHAGQVLLIP